MLNHQKVKNKVTLDYSNLAYNNEFHLEDFLKIQFDSFYNFLQSGSLNSEKSLHYFLKTAFPVESQDGKVILEFVSYEVLEPIHSIENCLRRRLTYESDIKAKFRIIFTDTKEVREKLVLLCSIPVMVPGGYFVFNGVERVVVNQVYRAPGILCNYNESLDALVAKIVPAKGSWLEFELDLKKELFSIRIDRKRRILFTVFLRALGLSSGEEILSKFYDFISLKIDSEETIRDAIAKYDNLYLAENIKLGENEYFEVGDSLTYIVLERFKDVNLKSIKILDPAQVKANSSILNTFIKDNVADKNVAAAEILEILFPGRAIILKDDLYQEVEALFFNHKNYDLGVVGRYRLNLNLYNLEDEIIDHSLSLRDVIEVAKFLIKVEAEGEKFGNLDHLGNRRVRSVGELLLNALKMGFARMQKSIKEKLNGGQDEDLNPQKLINPRYLSNVIREFFGTNQLSQFMEQVNPLSSLTHLRRISALGKGGLIRERAGFEVRDVHYTHYGRFCPIETPEGQNIGLILSLGTYTVVNENGFLTTPFYKVKNKRISSTVHYLTAIEEDRYFIGQYDVVTDKEGNLIEDEIMVRYRGDVLKIDSSRVDFVDISPQQLFSISTCLIPFLEHDDANRALMGSNMQRQALPLIYPEAPLVGTGLEPLIARYSRVAVEAQSNGIVKKVNSHYIEIEDEQGKIEAYNLIKYRKTNQGSCYNQSPVISEGEIVKKGDLLTKGFSIVDGELALGRNIFVALMSWEGYNFEDAIVISERLVKEDVLTSISIKEFEIELKHTKRGMEEFTRDIPHISSSALASLDEEGIVVPGTYVQPRDILVGRITPRFSKETSPEYKLLYSIFGDKARDVKETSLRVPYGVEGVVIKVESYDKNDVDDLIPGVERVVKVSIAQKQKIKVGDKLAGRHGNKGVVSVILPEADMPFLEDGTPIDLILNPLGVPSRMNIGQMFELLMGWIAYNKNEQYHIPIFKGPKMDNIEAMLQEAGLSTDGKMHLRDGKTGKFFKDKVSVGHMYILKLNHMIDDKMHARSVGPYSLIVQQPLGGKSQFGGQRVGEMEVWAFETYGAAYTLQELLTVKSDDIDGRARIYESIVEGHCALEPGVPESFNVIIQELRGLLMDFQIFDSHGERIPYKEKNLKGCFIMEKTKKKENSHIRINEVKKVRLHLVSPEKIIQDWSYGVVENAETVNYRNFKPEKGGLFCERIFGPIKDYECACGKYKTHVFSGLVCDKCGVEVTSSRVRRDRMGHIELEVPVAHIWFYKVSPFRLASCLGIANKNLKQVLYYEKYIVIDPGETSLKERDILSEEEYRNFELKHSDIEYKIGSGAGAIQEILAKIDLSKEISLLKQKMESRSKKNKDFVAADLKRLELLNDFYISKNRPEWMILNILPVIPPELRPMVQLEGGKLATSDLNDMYRRVIYRNNRLRKLKQRNAPDIILRNEKRMLQEAVDALLDNGRGKKTIKMSNNRPLKSLSDLFKGKQGRFRQNLLGKRVDYSGRSVIVISPKLKLYQCGIPKLMALELFRPFLVRELKNRGLVYHIKEAKKMIESQSPEIWDILDQLVKGRPVILNRAPTLHRLGIQAFEIVLVEGKAIQLHPLVCKGYNADFDGDQMAVHLPLSIEAQIEGWMLMLSTKNLLDPANGNPIVTPTQDILLGLYSLTKIKPEDKGEGRIFSCIEEAIKAEEIGLITVNTEIVLFISNKERVITSLGRALFNEKLPKGFSFFNQTVEDSNLKNLISVLIKKYGSGEIVEILDSIKTLGFTYVTKLGVSIALSDILIPDQKYQLIEQAQDKVNQIEQVYRSGTLSSKERYNRVIDVWNNVNSDLRDILYQKLQKDRLGFNPLFMMADSGARGNREQIRQLAGMRGLMAKPSGEVMDIPIKANFKEGLSVLDYFNSTHGARKGLADTSLKTADAGYLTRKLIDVAQNIVVITDDCGATEGTEVLNHHYGFLDRDSFAEKIRGRFTLEVIKHPRTEEVIVEKNEEITDQKAEYIELVGIKKVILRSVLECRLEKGLCVKCYGRNLATGRIVEIGEAVGIIAAQSIGQPGTQLTMRTFHVGGVASFGGIGVNRLVLDYGVIVESVPVSFVSKGNKNIVLRNGQLVLRSILKSFDQKSFTSFTFEDQSEIYPQDVLGVSHTGENILCECIGQLYFYEGKVLILGETQSYDLKIGSVFFVQDKDIVEAGKVIYESDLNTDFIIAEGKGTIVYKDILPGTNLKIDRVSSNRIIQYSKEEGLTPRLELECKDHIYSYLLPIGGILEIEDGAKVKAGDQLARLNTRDLRVKDITGGLPKVTELFEARAPKLTAYLAKEDGVIRFKEKLRDKYIVRLEYQDKEDNKMKRIKYLIPTSYHLYVRDGDHVKKGEKLCDGEINPHDILRILGVRYASKYLLGKIEEVYREQGVKISDKHISVIIRNMLSKVEVVDPGDTDLIVQQKVDRFKIEKINQQVVEEGGAQALYKPILMGITKASLNTDSFVAAASFQETTRVLTKAAVSGMEDDLVGLKENIIIGNIIPAGSGFLARQKKEQELKELIERQSLETDDIFLGESENEV